MIQRRMALSRASVLLCVLATGCSGSAFSSSTATGSSPLDGSAGTASGGATAAGGSSAGGSGSGGTSSGSGGSSGTSGGSGGSSGTIASGGSGTGVSEAGVVSPPDGSVVGAGGTTATGGTTAAGGSPTCPDPPTWYRDKDADGYGAQDGSVVSCAAPAPSGWTMVGGDCEDDIAEVHPGQTAYFGQPYGTSGPDSFDYDCSGTEEGNPALPVGGTTCVQSIVLGSCSGAGYLPAGTGRGANALCGSQKGMACSYLALGCVASSASNLKPYACR